MTCVAILCCNIRVSCRPLSAQGDIVGTVDKRADIIADSVDSGRQCWEALPVDLLSVAVGITVRHCQSYCHPHVRNTVDTLSGCRLLSGYCQHLLSGCQPGRRGSSTRYSSGKVK